MPHDHITFASVGYPEATKHANSRLLLPRALSYSLFLSTRKRAFLCPCPWAKTFIFFCISLCFIKILKIKLKHTYIDLSLYSDLARECATKWTP